MAVGTNMARAGKNRARMRVFAGLSLAPVGLLAGAAAANSLPVLAKFQPGQWTIREIGSTTGGRSVCIGDPAKILQIGHGDAVCTRSVIDSSPTKLTVQYSCPGKGQGQSILTFSTAGAFRLETQGLSGGAPFDFDYDVRRTGDCRAAPHARRPH